MVRKIIYHQPVNYLNGNQETVSGGLGPNVEANTLTSPAGMAYGDQTPAGLGVYCRKAKDSFPFDVKIGSKTWKVIQADDLTRGLRGTDNLDKNSGMFFELIGAPGTVTIDMQRMRYPLDVIFVSAENTVSRVLRELLPGMDATYTGKPVMFFVEVNAGETESVKVGDRAQVESYESKIEKAKVYLHYGQQPPRGAYIQTGPQGGRFYIDKYGSKFDLKEPEGETLWHGTASGNLEGAKYGIHVGSHEAAKQALEATIGVRADGKDWDGTQEYGKTLLAGKKTLRKLGPYLVTGYNCDAPEDDYYPNGKATYSNREAIPLTTKPTMMRVKIKGSMLNSPRDPKTDEQANSTMRSQASRGRAKNGYYYINIGEDEGSISAVVPNKDHLEILSKEHQPNPPYEGTYYDEFKHRWVKPETIGSTAADEQLTSRLKEMNEQLALIHQNAVRFSGFGPTQKVAFAEMLVSCSETLSKVGKQMYDEVKQKKAELGIPLYTTENPVNPINRAKSHLKDALKAIRDNKPMVVSAYLTTFVSDYQEALRKYEDGSRQKIMKQESGGAGTIASGGFTPTFGGSREIIRQKIRQLMEKSKVYLENNEEAPQGSLTQLGSRGGRFYESSKIKGDLSYDSMIASALKMSSNKEIEDTLGTELAGILNQYVLIAKGNARDKVIDSLFNKLNVASKKGSSLPFYGGGSVQENFETAEKSNDRLDKIIAIDSFMSSMHEDKVKPVVLLSGNSYTDWDKDAAVKKVLDYLFSNTESEDKRKIQERYEDSLDKYYEERLRLHAKIAKVEVSYSKDRKKWIVSYLDSNGNEAMKSDEAYSKGEADEMRDRAESEITDAKEHHIEKSSLLMKVNELVEKSKVYLEHGENAPKGEAVLTGKHGGRFYLTSAHYTDKVKTTLPRPDKVIITPSGVRVPNTLTDVWVTTDKSASLQAMGKTANGLPKYIHSAEFDHGNRIKKWKRLVVFRKVYPILESRIMRDAPKIEEALALYLITLTGFRIGSDKEHLAKVKAYGTCTLQKEHVKIHGDSLHFKFPAKKGTTAEQIIRDEFLAKVIGSRLNKTSGSIFHTNDAKVRDYLHSIPKGAPFKNHDFRTRIATEMAIDKIKSMPIPKSFAEFKKARKEVAVMVAAKLGDTVNVALKSYIAPECWDQWEAPFMDMIRKAKDETMQEFIDSIIYEGLDEVEMENEHPDELDDEYDEDSDDEASDNLE